MDNKKAEEIMQSYGVINVNYNGLPVWIERIRGDVAEVTFIDIERQITVPVSELTEVEPMQTV